MGQRSQIYVRYENSKGVQVAARYYGWNYGERMVSRARYIIEWLKDGLSSSDWFLDASATHKKLCRICDTNFDMIDVVLSSDIFAEFREFEEPIETLNDFLFSGQDNNDGKLLIDIKGKEIRYCFLDCDADIEHIMTADQYMTWEHDGTIYSHQAWDIPTEYTNQATIDYTRNNIEAIEEMARLMSAEEVKEYMSADYSSIVEEAPQF
jgi:hypothetical protein